MRTLTRCHGALLVLLSTLLPLASAAAHGGGGAGPHDLWARWAPAPAVLLPLLAGALWYARGAARLAERSRRTRTRRRRQGMLFASGFALLAVALLSPLDAAAEALFAAHMMQHLLLMLAVAPLLVLSDPGAALWWGVPARARRAVARWWRDAARLRALWRMVGAPPSAFLLQSAALWFWHFPVPYQAALAHEGLHALEHLSFVGTALLFWWVVLQPSGHRRLRYPAALIVLVATMAESGALGAFLMYARAPWYPVHRAGALAWGLTPLEDQQLAGLVMWIPAALVHVAAAVALFLRWFREDEHRAYRADALAQRRAAMPAALALVAVIVLGACTSSSGGAPERYVAGGDAERGRRTIREVGCGSCHIVPGVADARGLVGPPLIHWSGRSTIAGELPNNPEQLIAWITDPQAVEPGTDMPNMGLTVAQARDIAAYLYTIK